MLLSGSVGLPINIEGTLYESLNYILTTNNWHENNGEPELSMWPKRYASMNDYGTSTGSDDGENYSFIFPHVGVLRIKPLSDSVAEHNSVTGYGSVFDNNFIENLPFSVNICLDYTEVPPEERDDELENVLSKIDFLIACGMNLSAGKNYPDSPQYAARNDGMSPDAPQLMRVREGHLADEEISGEKVGENTWLYSVTVE